MHYAGHGMFGGAAAKGGRAGFGFGGGGGGFGRGFGKSSAAAESGVG